MRGTHSALCTVVCTVLLLSGQAVPAAAQELLHTLEAGPQYGPRFISFSSDEQFLATYDDQLDERVVVVWSIATGNAVATLPAGKSISAICFVPGQRTVALLNWPATNKLTFWDFRHDATRELQILDAATSHTSIRDPVAFSPDGNLLVVHATELQRPRGGERFIYVIRTDDGSLVADLELRGIGRQFHFTGDGSTLVVSDQLYRPGTTRTAAYVQEWDLQQREKRHEWGPFPKAGTRGRSRTVSIGRIELSPEGRRLALAAGNRIAVVDVATGRHAIVGPHPRTTPLRDTSRGFFGAPRRTMYSAVAFDPRGYQLATGRGGSDEVWLWPLAGGSSVEQLKQPHLDTISAIKYSRSGDLLAVGGTGPDGGRLHLWRLGDAVEIDNRD